MNNIKPELWFSEEEYQHRISKIKDKINQLKIDALIVFFPESVTWSTGFFTRGYSSFQFAIIPAVGKPHIICRDVEEFYIKKTSPFSDYTLWNDSDDKISVAAKAIEAVIGKRSSVAIEEHAWSLSVAKYRGIKKQLSGYRWQDGSSIVSELRLIKSKAEINYQKKAGHAAEMGMAAAIELAITGKSEREMAANVCSKMIINGSDRAGPGVLSSGERAMYLHGGYNDRIFQEKDKIQLETTPHVKYYHARFMRPIMVGDANDHDFRFVESLIKIQDDALNEVKPGVLATIPDTIYREGLLDLGIVKKYTNKTFYSIGLLMEPNGGEPLEAHPLATWKFKKGMTFHTYLLLNGFGMSETIHITANGYERLTNFPRKLFIGGKSI